MGLEAQAGKPEDRPLSSAALRILPRNSCGAPPLLNLRQSSARLAARVGRTMRVWMRIDESHISPRESRMPGMYTCRSQASGRRERRCSGWIGARGHWQKCLSWGSSTGRWEDPGRRRSRDVGGTVTVGIAQRIRYDTKARKDAVCENVRCHPRICTYTAHALSRRRGLAVVMSPLPVAIRD